MRDQLAQSHYNAGYAAGKREAEEQLTKALELAERHMNEKHRLEKRVDELLATANKYLQEARDARRLTRSLELTTQALIKEIGTMDEDLQEARKHRDNALKRARAAERSDSLPRVRHYKGGEYEIVGEILVQISTGMSVNSGPGKDRLYRHIYDGDKLIVYRQLDGSLSFGRFPDEFNDPKRFEVIQDGKGSVPDRL